MAGVIDGAMQDFPLTLDRFLDHAARWHPGCELVTASHGGEVARVGYAGLRERSRRLSALFADLGIVPGEHVATLAWNTQAHVESWYAIMGMGACCLTLNPRQTATELGRMAAAASCRVLIASADLLPLARALSAGAPGIGHILVIDGDAVMPAAAGPLSTDERPLEQPLEPLLERIAAAEPDGIAADPGWGRFDERSPAGLCFTSGTTGAPKGVTYTHRATFLHTLRLLQADVLGITRQDSVLVGVPMAHANAWGLPFAVPAVGAKLVLPGRRLDGASLAALIEREGVTLAVGVPTVWLGLLEHLEAHGGSLPSLRRICMGGAAMPPALMARLEQRLGVVVQTSWGMTELSPSGTVAPLSATGRSAALSGRPAIGVDLLLTDADGVPLPQQRGPEGHLRVRGAAVIERYFGQAEPATDAAGWFPTGDLARIDADGNLAITGRSKDLIKSGGEWINPGAIEAIVGAHPDISLAAVIGRQDEKWGERPILLVETRDDREVSGEDLIEALRGRVASWWLPDMVLRITAMPLTPTGKIDKTLLRSTYGSD